MPVDPKISICIPAYHAEDFLTETLESIGKQEFTEWELIVNEDGSKDGTQSIVEDFASRVRQSVRYIRNPENRGLAATRNAAMAAARAPWIALLDADDLWTPDHLSACYQRAEETGADLVHGGSILFDHETGKDLQERVPTPQATANPGLALYCSQYVIQPSSVLIKKCLIDEIDGFDPKANPSEDRECWIRCVRHAATIAYSGKITCRYRKHANAMSMDALRMARGSLFIAEKHSEWEDIPVATRKRVRAGLWSAVGRLCWRKDPSTAAGHFRKAFVIRKNPRDGILWILCRARSFNKTPAKDK